MVYGTATTRSGALPIPLYVEELASMHSVHDFRVIIRHIVRRCEDAPEPVRLATLRALKAGLRAARPRPQMHDCPSIQRERITRRVAWVDKYIRSTDLGPLWESI